MNKRRFQPMSLWARIKFVFGFHTMGNVMGTSHTLKELGRLIDGSVKELNENLELFKDNPNAIKAIKYSAAIQLRIARYNIVEAGYPDLNINTVYEDQP